MPSRSERIAALESQLANSRKRRSQLLGSLGKDSWGAGDAHSAPWVPFYGAPDFAPTEFDGVGNDGSALGVRDAPRERAPSSERERQVGPAPGLESAGA